MVKPGGIIYPIVFRRLLPYIGFAWTVRVIGFIALGTTLISVPMLHTGRVVQAKQPRPLLEVGAFTEIPYLVYNISGILKFMGFFIPFVYLPIYAEIQLHASTDQAFDLLAYSNAASFIGRILAACVADRIGVMIPSLTCAFSSAIICLTWVAVSDYGGVVVFSVLYGFFSGALIGLPSAILPYVSPVNVLGTRMGMTWALAGVALLIGSPIAGALIDLESSDFVGAQWFCGVMVLAGACCQIPLFWLIRDKLHSSAV